MVAAGYDPDSFLRRAFAALWEDERDLADDTTLITLADATGLPGEKLLAAARRPEAKSTYDKNIADAIAAEGFPVFELPSGAGHDGMAMIDIADVGMIFVRCRAGVSHNPDEHVELADADAGARVLSRLIENFRA